MVQLQRRFGKRARWNGGSISTEVYPAKSLIALEMPYSVLDTASAVVINEHELHSQLLNWLASLDSWTPSFGKWSAYSLGLFQSLRCRLPQASSMNKPEIHRKC